MNPSKTLQSGINALTRARSERLPQVAVDERIPHATSPHTARAARQGQTVEQMMAHLAHFPTETALMGICDDGLPVLFDLTDPRPGSLLLTGDSESGKTTLMQGLLRSLIAANSPYEVKYALIPSKPEEWAAYENTTKHCFSFHPPYEEEAGATILRLAEIAEQRRAGKEMGASIVLLIDDLRFMASADFDVRLNFEWLLKCGPEQGIWPVVSLSAVAAREMSRLVSYFRTRLIGHMAVENSSRITLFDGCNPQELKPGKQFAVRVENAWLRFTLPVRG